MSDRLFLVRRCRVADRRLQRPVFLITYTIFTLFHLGGALCHDIQTLLICRLLSGIFGSSRMSSFPISGVMGSHEFDAAALTNASGSLADIWVAKDRGVASARKYLTL